MSDRPLRDDFPIAKIALRESQSQEPDHAPQR